MLLEDLATELVLQIFFSCTSLTDLLALSATCRRFHAISHSSQRLALLSHATSAQYGPLHDLTQLLTHNASQPAHLPRSAPLSLALLKQMAHAGRVAAKWCDIYPFKKWKHDYASRRLLTAPERFRLRRAVYRIWLYARAFHNASHPRESRVTQPKMHTRAALLHGWPTHELRELADVASVMRDVVANNLCPGNTTVARKHAKRNPGTDGLLFDVTPSACAAAQTAPAPHMHNPFTNQSPAHNLWHTSPSPYPHSHSHSHSHFHYNPRDCTRTCTRDPAAEGWGDMVTHYYVVEDYMKLDPEQVLWLREHAPTKGLVMGYVRLLGGWFENNGETLGQTIDWVLDLRGEGVGGGGVVREDGAEN